MHVCNDSLSAEHGYIPHVQRKEMGMPAIPVRRIAQQTPELRGRREEGGRGRRGRTHTWLATLRWTRTSPGSRPMISFAGMRASEQPICNGASRQLRLRRVPQSWGRKKEEGGRRQDLTQRNWGFWELAMRLKYSGSLARALLRNLDPRVGFYYINVRGLPKTFGCSRDAAEAAEGGGMSWE